MEMEEISFSEEDELEGITSQLPVEVQAKIRLVSPDQRCAWVNSYLNDLTEKLPRLQQVVVKKQTTNSGKFSKLKEFIMAFEDKEKKQRGSSGIKGLAGWFYGNG